MGKTIIITEDQLAKLYPNIKFIAKTKFPGTLYKYWSYNRLMDVLINEELVFVNPSLWKDPFEKMYLETDYTEFGIKQPKIYCMCVATKTENEEAAWKIYSSEKDRTVRCKINRIALFNILNEFAVKENFTIYFGNINYDLTKAEIKTLDSKTNVHHKNYFEPFSLEKFLELLTLKRRAFKYENELRILIVPNVGNTYSDDILKIKIPKDQYSKLFSTFTIQPFDPIIATDPRSKIEVLKQDFENAEINKSIKLIYKFGRIYSSSLYSKCIPIKKVFK